ncbi:hypothetical protein ACAN107058_14975 [Paracidovorax anthurii]
MRRRSWRQCSSSASTPWWRASSQPRSAPSSRPAAHRSCPADVAGAGSSAGISKRSGSSSQARGCGASPHAWSSARSGPAPKRRAAPSRGSARTAAQVRQPMRSRLAACGRRAVSVASGSPCGTRRGGGQPACRNRSSASACRAVGPWASGGQQAGSGAWATWAASTASAGTGPAGAAGACCRSSASSRSRPPQRRSVPATSTSTASSSRATRGVKRSAHQPAAASGMPGGNSSRANGSAIQCMAGRLPGRLLRWR